MKKTQFKIGLLTACLISAGSVASAQSCGAESCDSKSCKCSKKHCDDKGLLEVINNAASNFEAKLASMIPERDKPCAKAKQKCDCDKCSGSTDFHTQYLQVAPTRPVAQPSHTHFAPPVAQPDFVRPPMPRAAEKHLATPQTVAPPNPIINPVPVPHSGNREVVPLPNSDMNNDPFTDEPSPNLQSVPSRPTSYLRSSRELRTDPQASTQKSMRSILMSKASSKSISDASTGLAKTTSTRRVVEEVKTQVEHSAFEQAAPEVVPASTFLPITNLRDAKAIPAASEQFVNPLRTQ